MNLKRLIKAATLIGATAATFFMGANALADAKLPSIFSDNMILQQETPINVWGTAAPGEAVSVSLGSEKVDAKADANGKWSVKLPAMKADGKPLSLVIKANNTININDVLLGEVWLCSGQSNMEMGVKSCNNAKEEIANANHPNIRLFKIPKRMATTPQINIKASWEKCSPETIQQGGWGGFSAAAYYFGRNLQKDLNTPIGLIDASWGGTCIETWTPPIGFQSVPELKDIAMKVALANQNSNIHKETLGAFLDKTAEWLKKSQSSMTANKPVPTMPVFPKELNPFNSHQSPTALYNGMIYGIVPFSIRGAIWYQGESNRGNGALYTAKMDALISGWRKNFKQKIPFYFVQIAPYRYGGNNPQLVPIFWEAQTAVMERVPDTDMIITSDIANLKDIHPKNKQEVGRRLALKALAKTYDKKDIVHSGPTFKKMKIDGDKIAVSFDNIADGLNSRDGKQLNWFEIIGENGIFVKADAQIDQGTNSVILSSPEVKEPTAVRFAWHQLAEPNLCNKAGLPANSFRAGKIPEMNSLKNVPDAKDYKLVYEIDLKNLGRNIKPNVDNSSKINGKFDRIAYCLELQKAGGKQKFVYVSMDAFTNDLSKIGIPTLASKANFQQKVNKITVASNCEDIKTGNEMTGGNIEFWPNNYSGNNKIKIPNASNALYDFGDVQSGDGNGYGSMQVHNYAAKQTIFAINSWKAGNNADIGIGNSTGKTRDWTFTRAGKGYSVKKLKILVRPKK